TVEGAFSSPWPPGWAESAEAPSAAMTMAKSERMDFFIVGLGFRVARRAKASAGRGETTPRGAAAVKRSGGSRLRAGESGAKISPRSERAHELARQKALARRRAAHALEDLLRAALDDVADGA